MYKAIRELEEAIQWTNTRERTRVSTRFPRYPSPSSSSSSLQVDSWKSNFFQDNDKSIDPTINYRRKLAANENDENERMTGRTDDSLWDLFLFVA